MNKGKELLTKLRDGLMTLKPEEFKYWLLVSEFDYRTGCGTVCCALGWAPRFIPESGFYWRYGELDHRWGVSNFLKAVSIFELDKSEINFMFYGCPIHEGEHDIEKFGKGYDATLQQVINRITYVIENCY